MLNLGISFGFLPTLPYWVFIFILFGLVIYAVKMRELFGKIGIVLIIIGGGGNFYSRLVYGGVVDNLSFFGIFYNNIWDYLIAAGVLIILLPRAKPHSDI